MNVADAAAEALVRLGDDDVSGPVGSRNFLLTTALVERVRGSGSALARPAGFYAPRRRSRRAPGRRKQRRQTPLHDVHREQFLRATLLAASLVLQVEVCAPRGAVSRGPTHRALATSSAARVGPNVPSASAYSISSAGLEPGAARYR